MAHTAILTERERRAWRGLISLDVRLLRYLDRQFQVDSGLSSSDYEVLVNLDKGPRCGLRAFELGAQMNWEKSRLSKHVSRMERRGLVKRKPCDTDSRGAFVALTPAGRRAYRDAEPKHLQHVRDLFLDVLSPEQLDALGEIAETVTSNVDRLADSDVSAGDC